MTCDEARQFILLLDSGELSVADRPRLDQHMRGCMACAAYGKDVQDTLSGVQALMKVREPSERVMHMLRREMQSQTVGIHSESSDRFPWRTVWALAASIMIVVLAGWWFQKPSSQLLAKEKTMARLVDVAVVASDASGSAPKSDATDQAALQDFADQLIILEGLDDDAGGLDFMESGADSPVSTDLQSRNSSALPSRICV